MTGLLPQRVLLMNWGGGAVITGKWKDVQPRGKEKMRGSTKRRNCEFLYFLFSNILNIYYLLLLRIVMNYSCAISGVCGFSGYLLQSIYHSKLLCIHIDKQKMNKV